MKQTGPMIIPIPLANFESVYTFEPSDTRPRPVTMGNLLGETTSWFCKPIEGYGIHAYNNACRTQFANELFRLMMPNSQPKTYIAYEEDQHTPFMRYSVLSEQINYVIPQALENRFDRENLLGVNRIMLTSLWLNPRHVTSKGIGCDTQGHAVRLNNAHCFDSLASPSYQIMSSALDDLYTKASTPELQLEINQAILCILLTPQDYLKRLTHQLIDDPKEQINMRSSLNDRSIKLRHYAVQHPLFKTYFDSPTAKKHASIHLKNISDFQTQGGPIIDPDEYKWLKGKLLDNRFEIEALFFNLMAPTEPLQNSASGQEPAPYSPHTVSSRVSPTALVDRQTSSLLSMISHISNQMSLGYRFFCVPNGRNNQVLPTDESIISSTSHHGIR